MKISARFCPGKLLLLLLLFSLLTTAPLLASGQAKQPLYYQKISELTAAIEAEIIAIRRDIHAHPELAFQEHRTAALVADYFQKLGLEVRTGIGGTGVLGVLKGGLPGPVLAMRGDMDALAITEETDLPFASREKVLVGGRETGLMHACGHDIHTALLLGVAAVLSRMKSQVPGTILFVAQPAEEWGDGAQKMLQDGVFRDYKPEAIFAFHVDDTLKAGYAHYVPGYAGANCDTFFLSIKSEGGHGADPDQCVDPIVVGSHVVLALQAMISREIDVHDHTVITVGYFHAGTATNIIPEKAELRATVRSYGDEQRTRLKEKITRTIAGICQSHGAPYELDYQFGTPALYNHPELLAAILPTAALVLGGKDRLIEDRPEMGGEDFSYFAREIPGVMLSLGVVPPHLEKTAVHSPTFIADEKAIGIGIRLMSAILMDYARKPSGQRVSGFKK
ncbi:MAG: M20 family metallopeptidase [Candidatus Saccharicenans sp.]|jgi:amidohydrolase|nr:M20 family metallopeptidase [Candidatus Saccharicenans sp.]